MRTHFGSVAALALALSASFSARADWPVARHDARRTGASDATSDIVKPAVYWRTYLGGTVSPTGMIATDVDSDGKTEVVFVTGGTLVAKTPADKIVWRTPPVGIVGLVGVDDLDGDGTRDVVCYSVDHAYVVNGKTGAFSWVEPDGEMGSLGGMRMADLSGDGKPDLLIEESACGGVNSGQPGFVYSFGGGFGAATLLWKLPQRAHCGSSATTIADLDGNGALEVVLGHTTGYIVLDGATGAQVGASGAVGTRIDFTSCLPKSVDGLPGEELVCVQNYNQGPGQGGRQVFVVKWTGGALAPLWQKPLGDYDGGDVSVGPEIAADLDGDGKMEVVASGMAAGGTWTGLVLDAVSGAELGKMPGFRVAGTAPVAAATTSLVLTTSGTSLKVWTFDRSQAFPLVGGWTLPDRVVATQPDWARVRRTSVHSAMLLYDQNGDGVFDLLTHKASTGAELACHAAAGGAPKLLATYAFPAATDPIATWVTPPINRAYDQVSIARNDGWLTILDKDLQPTNGSDSGPGMRIGGYYSGPGGSIGRAPLSAALDAGKKQSVIVPDSRGAMLRIDPDGATNTVPPKPVWARTHVSTATVVPGLDSAKPAIAALGVVEPVKTPADHVVTAIRAGSGTSIWSVAVPRRPIYDLVAGPIDADAVPDLVVQWFDTDTYTHTRALAGTDGTALWDAPPVLLSWGMMPMAAADWDADGSLDVLSVLNSLRAYTGKGGAVLASNPAFFAYFMPTLYDVDGDGALEVTLHGGYYPARTLRHDLNTPVWVGTEDDRPYPYGAIAACPSGPVLVEGSSQFPSRLKITQLGGGSAGQAQAFWLASGQKFATEADMKAAKALRGWLGNVSVEKSLGGGATPTALVGSTDGWMYAIDPCSGNVAFVHDFGAEVGEAVFGDSDGDGRDEILVSVADGFLYGLRNEALAAPAWIWDVDPDHGVVNADVDEEYTVSKLTAKWAAVAGADGYEIAVVGPGSNVISNPAWIPVGNVTQFSVQGLALQEETTYWIGVRATSNTKGLGADSTSDGVLVHFAYADAGADGDAPGKDAAGGASGQDGSGTDVKADGAAGVDAGKGAEGGAPADGLAAGGEAGAGGTAGTGASGAPGLPAVVEAGSDGGCGCRVAAARSSAGALALLALLAGVAARRRRRVEQGAGASSDEAVDIAPTALGSRQGS
jgi:MYXO-CTERM domain-containing protein